MTEILILPDELINDSSIPVFNPLLPKKFGEFQELTTTQINNLVSPRKNTFIFNTTLNQLVYWDGSSWQKITSTAM